MLDRQESTSLVGHDHVGEFFDGDILHGGLYGTGHTSDVDQDINLIVKNPQCMGDHIPDLLFVCHITGDDVRCPVK